MDAFFQRARERISKLTKKPAPSFGGGGGSGGDDRLSNSGSSYDLGGTGGGGGGTTGGRRSPSMQSSTSATDSQPGASPPNPKQGSNTLQPDGQSPGQSGDSRTRRKKDHTIFVHPLLDKEFEDNITPPRSPLSKHPPTGGVRQSPSTTGAGSNRSLPPSPSASHPHNPSHHLSARSMSSGSDLAGAAATPTPSACSSRATELRELLASDPVDIARLRLLCWGGCPAELRHDAWALLTGYHPPQQAVRADVVRRKRSEYTSYLRRSYDNIDWDNLLSQASASSSSLTSSASSMVGGEDLAIMKQIRKDVPRTSGGVAFLQHPRVMQTLERVLYTWAVRHPACGYVQGMNDLVLPFLYVALAACFSPNKRPCHLAQATELEVDEMFRLERCSRDAWLGMEADLYWMCSSLLSGLQENFTFDQAGIHAMVRKLEAVVQAADAPLVHHLTELGIPLRQFAFRWMNCLLIREFSISQVLRLWDTYLAEENDVSSLHVFVCASLLSRWSPQLCAEQDFSKAMTFLQNPPTAAYKERDMDELISEGYLKQQVYGNSNAVMRNASKAA